MAAFGRTLLRWYKKHARELPWRETRDPYVIWLSEVILQQTRVEQGLPYFHRFTKAFPTVRDLARAKEEKVMKLWQGLGYYSRARNLHKAAKVVANEYQGRFPRTFDELRSLPGVGDYTAAAIASFAFDQAVAVVDGNVFRFLSRCFGIDTPIDSPRAKREFRELAESLMEGHPPHLFNQAIMEFGAISCKPVQPLCVSCPFRETCHAYQHDLIIRLPVKAKKQKVRDRYFHYLIISTPKGVYLRQRTTGDIWAKLYEFPLLETDHPTEPASLMRSAAWKSILGKQTTHIRHISREYKHLLSHQRIHARFYLLEGAVKPDEDWILADKTKRKQLAVSRLVEVGLQEAGL
jgi:A/G-specific adenine glycosylase